MGCTKVSPACDGCYAEAQMDKRYGKVKWGPKNPRVRTSVNNWNEPRRWMRKALAAGVREFVFCASLADIFDNEVDPIWRKQAFNVMRETAGALDYLLLTKRPQNIIKMCEEAGGLPHNAALGTTVEDQRRAQINLPALAWAAVSVQPLFTFASCEPLLEPINFLDIPYRDGRHGFNALTGLPFLIDGARPVGLPRELPALDWVITGGETDQGGHLARPSNPQWFRDIRDQCEAAGIAYHHKQNGEWVSVSEVAGQGEHFSFPDGRTVRKIGKHKSGRTIDGKIYDARPVPERYAA